MVGPMGGSGLGLNLPGVEKAMIEMEGSGLTGEDLKEKFARLGRRVSFAYALIVILEMEMGFRLTIS